MDRKSTMARFKEPNEKDEPKYICSCEQCDEELYEGDLIYKSEDGTRFCSMDCALDFYGIKLDILEKEEKTKC
jgi:hypothetical protein